MIGFFNKFEVKGIALLRRVFGRDALFGHELSNVDSLVKGLHYALIAFNFFTLSISLESSTCRQFKAFIPKQLTNT
jgi:hypothetical protein